MSLFKKLTAVALVGGGLFAGYCMMPAKGVQNRKMTAELRPIRHDTFADHLHRKITSVARLKESHPMPVIFDTDAACDDALALILIGNDPGVDLRAVTVAGTGEAHGRPGAENMAAITRLLGKATLPVAFGREQPLSAAGKPFPAALRAEVDSLLAETNVKPDKEAVIGNNAVTLMRQVVENSPEKVTILATGPLTNVAEFIQKNPQLKSRIEKIVMMGGAVKVPGNISYLKPEANNKSSEWNFYADPAAVKIVFASGVPITLVALDATNQVPLTKKFLETLALEDQPDLKLANALMKSVVKYDEIFYLWDALAAVVLIEPSVAEMQTMPIIVNAENGSLKIGNLHQSQANNINVVTRIHDPEEVLMNVIAMVKSNHIFAERKFYHAVAASDAKNLKGIPTHA